MITEFLQVHWLGPTGGAFYKGQLLRVEHKHQWQDSIQVFLQGQIVTYFPVL
jgi:hypothetical protein